MSNLWPKSLLDQVKLSENRFFWLICTDGGNGLKYRNHRRANIEHMAVIQRIRRHFECGKVGWNREVI